MTEDCMGPFDRSKMTREEFERRFKELCDCTPTLGETLQRIRRNQELWLEYQQKCLNRWDPTLQQAIEHAGDIIRELSKTGPEGEPSIDLAYVGEKVRRLEKRLDDLYEETRKGRRSQRGKLL
jgi:hypothetical protein